MTIQVTLWLNGVETDISAYVKSIEGRAGIDDPGQRVASVGNLIITLDNTDRRFSPLYSSGPYYGAMRPHQRARVKITSNSVTYTVFDGYTRSWSGTSGEYGAREARVVCVDKMAVLNDARIALPLQNERQMGAIVNRVLSGAFQGGQASMVFYFAGQPSANDYFSVYDLDGTEHRYMFVTGTPTANQVKIGATLIETRLNLYNALTGGAGAGETYGNETTRPADSYATLNDCFYDVAQTHRPTRYYRMGETSGIVARDEGTNRADATVVGATLGTTGALDSLSLTDTGDPDKAMTFDGINDYLDVPSLEISRRSFTVACWAKASASSPPARQDLFSVFSANATHQALALSLNSDGSVGLYYYGDDATSAAGVVTFGAWTHYALMYDAATDITTVYVNGVSVISGSYGPFEGSAPSLKIGCNNGPSNHWKGDIDEWELHLRTLPEVAYNRFVATAFRYGRFGIAMQANTRGAWGNSLTGGHSGTNLRTSEGFVGGTDAPADAVIATGFHTFDVAGDRWNSDETTAMQAIRDVVDSERGLLWCARSGALTAVDMTWLFTRILTTPRMVIDSEQRVTSVEYATDQVVNHVAVTYVPQGQLTTGILFKSDSVIRVEGTGLEDLPEEGAGPGGRGTEPQTRTPGQTSVTLQAIDPTSQKEVAVRSLVLPQAAETDYTIAEQEDGYGADTYTSTRGGTIDWKVTHDATTLTADFTNKALGALYFPLFQVRGVGVTREREQRVERDNAASQALYGKRSLEIALPLGGNVGAFAETLASYELQRRGDPQVTVESIRFENQELIDDTSIWAIELGDVLRFSDTQLAVSGQYYVVFGLNYAWRGYGGFSLEAQLFRLDDVTYGLFDDVTYGVLDSTARMAL